DGIRDFHVTGVQTCALPIFKPGNPTIAGLLLTLARIYREADSLERALAYADSSAMELARNKRLPENAGGWFGYLPASRYTVDLTIERATILESLYRQSDNRRYLEELLDFVDGYSAFMASNLHALRSQAALIDQADINKSIYSIAMEACWTLSRSEERRVGKECSSRCCPDQ